MFICPARTKTQGLRLKPEPGKLERTYVFWVFSLEPFNTKTKQANPHTQTKNIPAKQNEENRMEKKPKDDNYFN